MNKIDLDYMKLSSIPELGSVGARALLDYFGNPEAVLNASYDELKIAPKMTSKKLDSILKNKNILDGDYLTKMKDMQVEYFSIENEKYPTELLETSSRPLGLYVKGNADVLQMPCIAIVGTRLCSLYGEKVAREFAYEFAKAGYCVISGLAKGVDTAAHWGALEAGGATIAVLGGGVDVIYPQDNANLYNKILENNAVISEYTISRRVDKRTFPQRNRIIAGIAIATVVVESAPKGGSMITAGQAGDFGRDVFAVPGRIDSIYSKGTNTLISQGVNIACSAQDVIDQLNFRYGKPNQNLEFNFSERKTKEVSDKSSLSPDEEYVYSFFKSGASLSTEEAIMLISDFPPNKLISIMSMLEIKKYLARNLDSHYELA